MKVVLQRVTNAKVEVAYQTVGLINQGLLIFLGIASEDTNEDVDYLLSKIVNLRIFSDTDGKMNQSIIDIKGSILVVSQFTLHANTKKGTRPSFIDAARPDVAIPLYEKFIAEAKSLLGSEKVETGIFGANMQISLTNDGPVTIILDSKA